MGYVPIIVHLYPSNFSIEHKRQLHYDYSAMQISTLIYIGIATYGHSK